jgi:hypothetical protein
VGSMAGAKHWEAVEIHQTFCLHPNENTAKISRNYALHAIINLLRPTGYVMHQQV